MAIPADENFVREAYDIFIKHYREHMLDNTRAYGGMIEALRAIRRHTNGSVAMAVLTNKPVNPSRRIINGLGMEELFIQVYGGNSFDDQEAGPARGLDVCCARPRPNPAEAVMIGDSQNDVLTARNSGMWAVGVTYGFSPDSLKSPAPDVLIDSPHELLEALGYGSTPQVAGSSAWAGLCRLTGGAEAAFCPVKPSHSGCDITSHGFRRLQRKIVTLRKRWLSHSFPRTEKTSMYRIVQAKLLGRNIKQFEIEAPRIARKQRPGQFVIVRLHENGERIPLTIEGADPEKGTITLVVQSIGKTTYLMNSLEAGDAILDVVGPLGKPTEIEKYGTVVVVGGSVGTAIALPAARALKQAGNHVIGITGSRTKELLILENELRAVSDETYVMTDDGSYGEQGLVTKKLQELIDSGRADQLRPRHRPGSHDARRRAGHPREGHQDRRQPELDHGGWHRHVRRMPRAGRLTQRVRLRRRPRVRRPEGQFRSPYAAQQYVPRKRTKIAERIPGQPASRTRAGSRILQAARNGRENARGGGPCLNVFQLAIA